MQDPHYLQELKQAFSQSVTNGVIDLDRFLVNRQSCNILRIEDIYDQTNGIVPPFRNPDFLILFIKHGKGQRSIGHFTFPTEDNSLVVVPRHIIHAATYTERPEGYMVSFNPDFFLQQAFPYKLLNSKRVLKPVLKPYVVLTDEQAGEVEEIFKIILEECNNSFDEQKQMIALKLLELLVLCERYFTENDDCYCTTEYSDMMQSFTELIEANYRIHRDVQFYAEALHTHPNNLNHIVKKATGLTAKQTITNRLIIEAKYLLVSTSLTVKEIAYELGFEDPNYFNSFFKKEGQASPAQYRNQIL